MQFTLQFRNFKTNNPKKLRIKYVGNNTGLSRDEFFSGLYTLEDESKTGIERTWKKENGNAFLYITNRILRE